MSNEIAREDIAPGDTITVSETFTVGTVTQQEGRTEFTIAGDGRLYHVLEGARVQLVDRPRPPLPTKAGTVLRVSSDMPNPGIWILTEEDGQNPQWVSGKAIRFTPERFAEFIQEYPSRTFEVIA